MADTAPPSYNPEAGFVVIEDLLTADQVAAVLSACDELFQLPPAERHARDRGAQGTRHLDALHTRISVAADVATHPRLLQVVGEILGGSFTTETVSLRSPQSGHGGQRLHTDDVAKLDDGVDQVATAIVALADFTEVNGATRVVPGSHRRPDLQRLAGSLESHADNRQLAVPAGAAIVFSGHLLHSGMPNRSATDRPALQMTWRREAQA